MIKNSILATMGGTPPTYIEDVFSTYLLPWSASTQTVTNGIDLTKGGLVWSKVRSGGAADHCLNDSERNSFANRLVSNSTAAQNVNFSATEGVTAVSTTGFTYRTYTGYSSSYNYATWTFRKQPKFFDVVTYTGNNSSQTISHNLGSTPGCIIVKCATGADGWFVYHSSLGASKYLRLDLTDAPSTSSGFWGSVTSTSFGTTAALNASGQTYVAYLFAHDAGGFGLTGTDNVISCGSYTTDASGYANVDLGWQPQFLLLKNASGAGNWLLIDNMRGFTADDGGGNTTTVRVMPNSSAAEGLSNIALTTKGFYDNASVVAGGTVIYIAIRRGPMKVPTDGTTVFAPVTGTYVDNTALTTNFPVDLMIASTRAGTTNKATVDRLRGASSTSTAGGALSYTNLTNAETTAGGVAVNWNNTSIAVGTTFGSLSSVWWNFRRAPSFFDEVCYKGTNTTNRSIPHNLGVAPELMIFKYRNGANAWYTYHTGITSPNANWWNNYVALNTTAAATGNTTEMNQPTSANIVTGSSSTYYNNSTYNYVVYLFATCPGVSKVGSYTGTGTTKQVDCGFAAGARFVLIKRTDSTGGAWYVWDTARGIVSGNDPYLLLNSTAAEVTGDDFIDTYSAGFEISSTAPAAINASGGTFIFLAIA